MVIKDRYQHAKKTPAAQFILFIFSWREYNSLSFDMAIILKDSTLVLFVPICSDNNKIMVSWCIYASDGLGNLLWMCLGKK